MTEKHPMKCIECGTWNDYLWTICESDYEFKKKYHIECFNGHRHKENQPTESAAWDKYFERNMIDKEL